MGFHDFEALSPDKQHELLSSHLPLGKHFRSHEMFAVRDIDRFRGTYILGIQGSGKSGSIKTMVRADIEAGRAVIVIDPHGDLVNDIVAEMPPERLHQTYVLDMLDEQYPFGINIFGLSGVPKTLKEKGQAVDRVMHVFEVLFGDVLKQQHLPLYLKTATVALISTPGMTLAHMKRFLTEKPFRDQLLAAVADPSVRDHWAEHDALSEKEQHTRLQPLINRLGALFVGRDIVQNIMGQPTTISFRQAIDHREIVLIKLPTTELEQDASLIGRVIVAQVSAALFSYGDTPPEQRPGFSLYVDEFQHFTMDDFAKLFSEGRKFGIKVTLAHQLRGQLPEKLAIATASAYTKICFQLTAENAREMAPYFPAPDDGRLEKVETRVCAALLDDPGPDHNVRALTDRYLRPLQSQPKKGGRIHIAQGGVSLASVLWVGYQEAAKAAKKADPLTVEEPTQYLDDLLRDVMQQRNPNLPIPPKVIVGFANCGRGFYHVVSRLRPCVELTAEYPFPQQLVAGDRWLREPKSDHEQFLHLVFTLRQTMTYLAAHPMGKKADISNAAVAGLLSQLPTRHALVRSGDQVGRIYTYDNPPKLEEHALDIRRRRVQLQTRAKYCHTHEQVQKLWQLETALETTLARTPAPVGKPAVPPARARVEMAQIAGWGEVGEP